MARVEWRRRIEKFDIQAINYYIAKEIKESKYFKKILTNKKSALPSLKTCGPARSKGREIN